MHVELSGTEMMMGSLVGQMRQVQSLRRGHRDAHGAESDRGWEYHIQGACGELAVAKALNLHWEGTVGGFKAAADVGQLEVRTRSKHTYDLLVRENDHPESVYILVTGTAPSFVVRGWLLGRSAMQPEFWKDPNGRGGAFFVPHNRLNPIDELR